MVKILDLILNLMMEENHFFHGYINDINQYMNPPMSTPTNQNPKYWNNLNK